jgi:hypothetical protein
MQEGGSDFWAPSCIFFGMACVPGFRFMNFVFPLIINPPIAAGSSRNQLKSPRGGRNDV